MVEEKKVSVGEIVRRLDELKRDKKVQEYFGLVDTLKVTLKSAKMKGGLKILTPKLRHYPGST